MSKMHFTYQFIWKESLKETLKIKISICFIEHFLYRKILKTKKKKKLQLFLHDNKMAGVY